MVEYTTKSEMRSFASNLNKAQRQSLRESAAKAADYTTTFLSHSSKDKSLVTGAMKILSDHGAVVYIDEIDPTMPPYTSDETAAKLKDKISQTKKFVLLATENSKNSKWVPWELGIADGYKTVKNVAIFPSIEDEGDSSWTSWEYLGLYHRIVWGNLEGHDKALWMVLDEKQNTAITLNRWLKR